MNGVMAMTKNKAPKQVSPKNKKANSGSKKRDRAAEISSQGFNIISGDKIKYYGSH